MNSENSASLNFLLIHLKEKAFFFFFPGSNDKIKARDFSALISLPRRRKKGRKRRATVISQGPPQERGSKGHFLSICALRRRAGRLCQCHGPFCGGSAAGGQPLPQPCSRCGRTPSPPRRLSLAHGGREGLFLLLFFFFFPSLLCVEAAHKSLPGPLLERNNNKRAVPSFLF